MKQFFNIFRYKKHSKLSKQNKIILIGGLIVVVGGAFFYWRFINFQNRNGLDVYNNQIKSRESILPTTKTELILIQPGDTYGVAMARSGLDLAMINNIYSAAKDIYDLAQIRVDYNLELVYGYQDNIFQELIYKIDTERQLSVKVTDDGLRAELKDIPYETRIVTKSGEIKSSLYEAALAQGIDERAVIAAADTFQWTLDFAMDPRVGDTFKFIYEERYLDGQYVRPGKILAGRYVNDGKAYSVYYFAGEADNSGYFDEEGNSVQKLFLKAPVAFKYISSGFTTGKRYVEAFNVSTGHRAIDYAAPAGTPIRSVGDGTVILAGWNGSYGYMVSVRHNGTYSTNYAHMSKMAVKRGAKVKQGDVIGYVGSTGFSTGPHLHYEMVKNGVKVNPLAEVMPPGKALSGDSKATFFEEIKAWRDELDK